VAFMRRPEPGAEWDAKGIWPQVNADESTLSAFLLSAALVSCVQEGGHAGPAPISVPRRRPDGLQGQAPVPAQSRSCPRPTSMPSGEHRLESLCHQSDRSFLWPGPRRPACWEPQMNAENDPRLGLIGGTSMRKPEPGVERGAWALARFCAPWVSNAGEKEKNALPRRGMVLRQCLLGTTSGVGGQPRHSFPFRLAIVCGAKSVPKPTRPGALRFRATGPGRWSQVALRWQVSLNKAMVNSPRSASRTFMAQVSWRIRQNRSRPRPIAASKIKRFITVCATATT